MTQRDILLSALAACGASTEIVEALLARLQNDFPNDQLYVFQTSGSGGGTSGEKKPRTLVAFATPDAALQFAQRNHLLGNGVLPRLRSIALLGLLLAMARDPLIQRLVLVRDGEEVGGHLAENTTIERSSLGAL